MRKVVSILAVTLAAGSAAFAQDPVAVDPDHYTVVLENDRVRVLRGTYPAGESSQMHRHPDLVAIMLSGASFEMETPEAGEPVQVSMAAGEALWNDGMTHRPHNVGDSEAQVVLVELKSPAGPETANVELLRGAYDAFGRGDVAGVLAILAPEVEWTEAEGHPYSGTYVGPDAVLENVFARIGADWSSFTVTPEEFVADGDHVVVLGDYAGTHGATGKSFGAPFAHTWRIEDGKVIRFRQFTDTAPVVTAASE